MPRLKTLLLCLCATLLMAGTAGSAERRARIPEKVLTEEPTAWATVKNPPNHLLLGHWVRLPPHEFNNPDEYEYVMVKRGEKYAVYLYWKGHEPNQRIKGWQPFVLDGERIESQVDGSVFFTQFGSVFHNLKGRPLNSRMVRVD